MQDKTRQELLSWSVLGVSLFCGLAWLLLFLEDVVEGRNYAIYIAGLVIAAVFVPTIHLLRRKKVGDRARLAVVLSLCFVLAGLWLAIILSWPSILNWPRHETWLACQGDEPAAAISACTALLESPNAHTSERRNAFRGRAMAYEKQRDYLRALADYDEALGLDRSRASAFNDRGVVRMKMGDLDGAIADYDAALRIATRDGLVFANRGIARQRKGDLDGAIADYTQTIALDPKYPSPRFNRGAAFEVKGDLDAARADFVAYRTLRPDEPDGRDALARIERAIKHRATASRSDPARGSVPSK